MPAYKDAERGSWYCQFYYEDWIGKRKKKYKRGFRTKKEAQDYESEFKGVANADMDMTVTSFVDIYFNDKSSELKDRSKRNKRYMIQSHVIPYLGEKKMNETLRQILLHDRMRSVIRISRKAIRECCRIK